MGEANVGTRQLRDVAALDHRILELYTQPLASRLQFVALCLRQGPAMPRRLLCLVGWVRKLSHSSDRVDSCGLYGKPMTTATGVKAPIGGFWVRWSFPESVRALEARELRVLTTPK